MNLLLVRHGEDVRGEAGIRALSAKGRLQAQAAGSWLRSEGVDSLYWSPARRTRETVHGFGRLHSMRGGPDARISEIRAGHGQPPRARGAGETTPGYETWTEFLARVAAFVTELLDTRPDQRVGLVTHSGVFDALHELATGSEGRVELAVGHGCVTSWTYDRGSHSGRWILNFHNLRPHRRKLAIQEVVHSADNHAGACDHLS